MCIRDRSLGAVPHWESTDEGSFRLRVEAFGEALCLEKALESAGIEFIARDLGSARSIELLPAFVDRLLQDPSMVARAKATIATLGARYQHTITHSHAPGGGGPEGEVLRTAETFMGFHIPFPNEARSGNDSSLRRRGTSVHR